MKPAHHVTSEASCSRGESPHLTRARDTEGALPPFNPERFANCSKKGKERTIEAGPGCAARCDASSRCSTRFAESLGAREGGGRRSNRRNGIFDLFLFSPKLPVSKKEHKLFHKIFGRNETNFALLRLRNAVDFGMFFPFSRRPSERLSLLERVEHDGEHGS